MWGEFKSTLLQVTGATPYDLHILLGLAIYLGLALILRGATLPLIVLAAVQLTNEVIDLVEDLVQGKPLDRAGFVLDTIATLAAPVAIAALLLGAAAAWRLTVRRSSCEAHWHGRSQRIAPR